MTRHVKPALFALVLAIGCTKVTPETHGTTDDTKQGYAPAPAPAPAPKSAKITLTSVTFADDCGGEAPAQAPAKPAAPARPAKRFAQPPAEEPVPAPSVVAPGDSAWAPPEQRRCVQTSMALEIEAPRDASVAINSVDVYDEAGKKLGSLTASKPRRWSDAAGAYEDWDGKLAGGTTAQVTYVLEQPAFLDPWEPRDRTYTVKVSASVGGVNQPLQTTVMVVGRPPPVPT